MADWRDEVDRWWAQVLQLPATAVPAGGVYAADHAGHVGVVAAVHAADPLGYGPADTLPALRAALAQADGDFGALGRCLTAALGPRAGGVVGPAWYGYATRDATLPARRPAVRSLTMADLPLLTRLHQQTPPVEREESGTTGLPAFGYLEGGDLLSVAYLGM